MRSSKLYGSLLLALACSASALAHATPTYTLRVVVPGVKPAPAPPPPGAAAWALVGSPNTVFANTVVGNYAATDLSFSLKNTGTAAGAPGILSFTGANSSEFVANNTCSAVAVNSTCPVTVRWKPTAAGARTADLTLPNGSALTYSGSASPANGDPYFSSVTLLMHFEGANGSKTFTDVKGNTFTATSATISNASKVGTGAFYGPIDANSKLVGNATGALAFGTGDFTVEFWMYLSDPTQGYHQFILSSGTAANSFNVVRPYNTGSVNAGKGGTAYAPSLATWHHYAFVRISGTIKAYVDGVENGSIADTTDYSDTNVWVGGLPSPTGRELSGYLDELRVTKGVGRYTKAFTPSTTAFPDF